MGKSSSAKAEVTEYRMSIHFGVALKLDSVNKILVDEKLAWSGTASANTTLSINRPDLFGGEKKEGGLVGAIDVLLGANNQVLPASAASRYGLTASDCPAFRGLTTLMFRGSGQVTTGEFNNWDEFTGEWNGNIGDNGFLWKHNTPLIAQKVEVEGTCAPKAAALNQAYAMIGDQANPIHVLYELLVDDEFGMGGSPDAIDTASYNAAAQTLFNEAFGLTILWMRQTKIEALTQEILDHIQASQYVDTNTGLWTVKLYRDDYDVEDLFVISPTNAKLSSYRVRSGGEIVNEMTVSWTNPENEKSESITGQNIASIASQGGEKVSGSRNYYGVRSAELARKLLERDLREASAPLISCEAVVDRSAWNLAPGSVVLLDWPRRNLYGLVMRVGSVNYGRPGDAKIRVPLVQDVFSLARPPIVVDPGTGWEDPSSAPSPLTMQLTTLPAYFSRNASLQTEAVSLTEPEVLVMSLADSQDDDSLDYELMADTVGPTGATVPLSRGAKSMTPLAYLGTSLSAAATSELPAALFPDINWSPSVGGFVWIGTGDTAQEIALVTGRTATGWTIDRGCLDTVPRTWSSGTPVWAVNAGSSIVDTQVTRAAGETVTYRGLDRTSQGLLAYADAPAETATLTARPHLPLRPAKVTVGGVAFGSYAIGGATTFEIAWATRNRLLEDSQVLSWTDGPVLPEYRQETVIRAYDVATGNLVLEYGYLWLENSVTFLKASFARYASVRFEVLSRRDDLESLTGHSVIVTGFANNPAAPLPPAPPARTVPPSPGAAPGVSAFTATATTDAGPSGTQIPTITIAGTQDNPDASSLVTRYRQVGSTDWIVLPSVTLVNEAVTFEITGVQPATTYDVEVAYVVEGVVGQYRTLADVLTGSIVSTDVTPITPGTVTGAPTISITSTIASDGTQTSRLFGSWTAPANALTYVVELDNGTILQQFPVTENAVEDRIVATGPTYRYRVKALSRTGTLSADWSSWSAYATAAGKTTLPPAVTSGSATAIGGRRVRVVQKRPAMADYLHTLIYRNTTGMSPDDVPQGVYTVATDEEFVDVNVTVGTNYRYYARTVDRSGNEAATATFLGNAIPVFTSVAGGDVNPTDPVLVNTQISVNGLGALSGIGTGNNTIVANSQAAFAPRRAFNFDTDAEGFNGIGVTINWYAHGIIHVASTSSDPILYTPTFSYRGSTIRKIRARIRYTSATVTWEGSCFWRSTTLGWSGDRRVDVVAPPPFVQNQWSIVEWDMTGPGGGDPYTEGTILELRFDLSSSFGDWEIDWIALGSEAVDPVGVRGITDLANRTQDNTALYIQGQADWATYTGRTTTHLANAIDTSSYLISGLNTHFRPDQMMNGAVGTQLAFDPEFHQAWPPADSGIYNNAGGTKVTVTRVADAAAPNASGFKLTIAYDGTGTPNSNPTPGFGGIYQGLLYAGDGNPSRPNRYAKNTKILYKIWANIPVGRTLETAANSYGNEGTATWLTSQAGTGNWALYELIYYIGTTGTFSSIGHMYVAGGTNVAFSWHIAKYEQVDITSGVSAFTGNLRRVNNGAALSDTLLVTGDGTAAFVAGQSPWVTDTSITPSTVTNRTQRLTSAGQIDFAYIEGATRPSPNAGTSGVLTPIGSHSTVVGNSVTKQATGTHGAFEGGAAGSAQRGSAYIRCSLLSASAGGGWYTQLALDDDATSFASGNLKYWCRYITNGGSAGTVQLYSQNDTLVAAVATPLMYLASRMTLGYDGSTVFVDIDGIRYCSAPAPAGLTLWPKVIDFYKSIDAVFPSAIVDIQYGAWTENTVSTVTLVPYNAEASVTGSTATKVGGSNGGWGAGVYSRDRFTGSAYCTFRVGTHTQPYFMAGLASSAFDGVYSTINYSWYVEGLPATSPIRAYVGGHGIHWEGAAGTWALTDVLTIVYDGVRVQWFQNGVLRATYTPVAAGQVLGFAASQVYIGNNLIDIQVGPALQVPRIGQNTFDDSGGTLVGRTNLITSLGTANLVANQTRFATATSLSTADADIAAPWSALDSRPAVTQGDSLTEDTAMADPSSWTGAVGTFATITDGRVARTVFRGTTGTMAGARHVPVDAAKTYMVEGWYRSVGGTTVAYAGVDLQDGSGNTISEDGTYYLYMPAGYTIGTGWEYYSRVFGAGTARPIPANARQMRCLFFPNYSGGANSTEVQGLRIVEVTTVGGSLRRADGTVATEAALVTSLGTANLVVNQGPGATALANRVLNDRFEGGVKLIQQPDGGQYNNPVSGQVGQLEIVLPFAWNAASPMITFDVLVHDYTAGRTSTYTVAGHHYNAGSNGAWINVTATFNGPRVFSRPVKFGFNAAGKATVWIGSVGDLWQYPNITIRNVQIGYNSQALAWESGWSVALNNTAISGTYVNMTTPYWARIVDVPRSGDQVFGEGIYEAPPGSGLPGDNVIATRASHRTDQGTALNIVSQAPTATSSDFAVVTGATRPSDRATSDLSMIAADAHVTIQGNRIGKASGGYTWTTGSAYSRQWYVGGASASARRLQSGGLAETMFGLSDSYTLGDAGYVHIDYAFYLFSSSSLPHIQLYEGGAPQGAAILVAMGDLFTVTYDGVNVRYYRESAGVSTLLRTVATTAARAFRVHVATTGADNISSGVEDLRLTPFNRAARVDELWSTDGATQYAENLIRTAAGTALNVINQGALATSLLTEAKVQGRWFGQYAGDSAANTAGLQNGDSYVDTSVYPPVLKGKTGGTIYEISETGILLDTDTDVDLVGTGTTFTDVHSFTLPAAISTSSFFVIQLGLSIVSGTTVSGSGVTAPSGLWQLWEFDSASTDATKRMIHSGAWASQIIGAGPNAANLTDITVDGDNYSDISRQWKFKFGGGGILKLRMHQGGGPNLLNARSHIRVTVQRN